MSGSSHINQVQVDLSIVLGSADVPIGRMLKMGRGAMIPLGCGEDDPTLLYVNGSLVAEGQILIEDERMLLEVSRVMPSGGSE